MIQARRAAARDRRRLELEAMPDEPDEDPFDFEREPEDDDSGWDGCEEDEG